MDLLLQEANKRIVNYQTWQRLERAVDLILKWDSTWRPHKGWVMADALRKLEEMGLLDTFWEQEKRREGGE